MKETILEMRRRLEPLYGAGETQAMIREIFRNLKGWDATEREFDTSQKILMR